MKNLALIAGLVILVILAAGIFGLVWNRHHTDVLRDWVLIVFFSIGILTGLVMLVATVAVSIALIALIGVTKTIVTEKVVPLTESAKETMENIRGTSEFMSDRAVKPIVKTYSSFAGARRAAGVFTGLSGRKG